MRQYIEAGKIVNTHGINGGVKIESWCDSPKVLACLKRLYLSPKEKGEEYVCLNVVRSSVLSDRVVTIFEGINTPEAAERLKNTVVFACRDDIPLNGGVLIDDIKGLPVIDERDGRIYGRLSDVLKAVSGDIYEIKTENGTVLMPAVKEYVSRIEPENAIFVTPIKGFFDEN